MWYRVSIRWKRDRAEATTSAILAFSALGIVLTTRTISLRSSAARSTTLSFDSSIAPGRRCAGAHGIGHSHFDAVLEHLGEAMLALDVAPPLVREVLALADSVRADVLGLDPARAPGLALAAG
jgi:hypothetical protein